MQVFDVHGDGDNVSHLHGLVAADVPIPAPRTHPDGKVDIFTTNKRGTFLHVQSERVEAMDEGDLTRS